MTNGNGILLRFLLLFSGLLIAALSRGYFVTAAFFALSVIFSLAAEALWLVGENRKDNH